MDFVLMNYVLYNSSFLRFFTQMSDYSDFTSDEEKFILCRAPASFTIEVYPMIAINNENV